MALQVALFGALLHCRRHHVVVHRHTGGRQDHSLLHLAENDPVDLDDDPWGYKAQFGYYTDRETDLLLCTTRYYDPVAGRFLTEDPIGYAGGLNLYRYCDNNPVDAADPLGWCSGDDPWADFLRWFGGHRGDWFDNTSNFAAGWGDNLSWGASGRVRMWLGVNDEVDESSGWYLGGQATGTLQSMAMGKLGGGNTPAIIAKWLGKAPVTVVIGRGKERVMAYALQHGYEYFKASDKVNAMSKGLAQSFRTWAENVKWAVGKRIQGATIIDLGKGSEKWWGWYYGMEKVVFAGYGSLIPVTGAR